MLLPSEAVAQLAACTRLRDLHVGLHVTVRDDALRGWTALTGLTALRLRANFDLSDACIAKLLEAAPHLKSLWLEVLNVSSRALVPLRHLPDLRRLTLCSCLLSDKPDSVAGALAGATELRCLEVVHSGNAAAMVAPALRSLPALHRLRVVQERQPTAQVCDHLAAGAAACTELRRLALTFNALAPTLASGSAIAAWASLASLTRVSCGARMRRTQSGAGRGGGASNTLPRRRPFPAPPQLRSLHICTGLGWGRASVAAVCRAATGLRALALVDNCKTGEPALATSAALPCRAPSGRWRSPARPPPPRPALQAVTDDWLLPLLGLENTLSHLELHSCRQLTPGEWVGGWVGRPRSWSTTRGALRGGGGGGGGGGRGRAHGHQHGARYPPPPPPPVLHCVRASLAACVPSLCQLTTLTHLAVFRSPGVLAVPGVAAHLEAALPCLAMLSMHE